MQSDLNILQVDKLSKYFGGLAAVSNCSIKIKKGSITGIIGPNGSGKTTLFNLIAGNLKPSEGNVLFQGKEITTIFEETNLKGQHHFYYNTKHLSCGTYFCQFRTNKSKQTQKIVVMK